MVRRIKALAAVSGAILDNIRNGLSSPLENGQSEDDRPIGVLVRNAFRHEEAPEADVSRVWAELSSRVLGPFGRLAVEGPAFAYTDIAGEHSLLQARDGLAPCASSFASIPASAEVQSTTLYRGADSHQMNLR